MWYWSTASHGPNENVRGLSRWPQGGGSGGVEDCNTLVLHCSQHKVDDLSLSLGPYINNLNWDLSKCFCIPNKWNSVIHQSCSNELFPLLIYFKLQFLDLSFPSNQKEWRVWNETYPTHSSEPVLLNETPMNGWFPFDNKMCFLCHLNSLNPCSNLNRDQCMHAPQSSCCLFSHLVTPHQCLQLHQSLQSTQCFPCLKQKYDETRVWYIIIFALQFISHKNYEDC